MSTARRVWADTDAKDGGEGARARNGRKSSHMARDRARRGLGAI